MDEFAAAANTNEGADNNCCGDNENFVDTPNEASTDSEYLGLGFSAVGIVEKASERRQPI
ncbi:unnamed protein product [Menidia menidia]|uniref:(Atlantic silverside) hypothetical protein n=1 Tax=Menidia menidia TaxID=238744 RepID=A0A8S4BZ19_9TELE|nr:unnamed protein product [Menidia menidia]